MASLIEKAKQIAAQTAITNHIAPLLNTVSKEPLVIGIGSGSTITYAIQHLHSLISTNDSQKRQVLCVPTSFQSRQLLLSLKMPVTTLDQVDKVQITVDGADEVDVRLNLIKGGGGCHFQEKLVASCSETLVIVADDRKMAKQLGTAVIQTKLFVL